MTHKANTGYVYLFVCTSSIYEGKYLAKYGCTRSSVRNRLYHAQSKMNCKFDTKIQVMVKNPYKVECAIKWGWKDPEGYQYYAGSEFVGINPEDLDYAIKTFEEIANG